MSEDKRRAQRILLPHGLYSLSAQENTWKNFQCLNISGNGIGIKIKDNLQVGDEIFLQLLPLNGKNLKFQGKVVRVSKDNEYGLEIISIEDDAEFTAFICENLLKSSDE